MDHFILQIIVCWIWILIIELVTVNLLKLISLAKNNLLFVYRTRNSLENILFSILWLCKKPLTVSIWFLRNTLWHFFHHYSLNKIKSLKHWVYFCCRKLLLRSKRRLNCLCIYLSNLFDCIFLFFGFENRISKNSFRSRVFDLSSFSCMLKSIFSLERRLLLLD